VLKFAPMSAPRRKHSTAVRSIKTHIGLLLLALCLVGTQLLGFSHRVAHAGVNPSTDHEVAAKVVYAAEHSCVLFDALALASCAGPATLLPLLAASIGYFFLARHIARVFSADPLAFQSRAPPAPLS
jgi:hypothetical protein